VGLVAAVTDERVPKPSPEPEHRRPKYDGPGAMGPEDAWTRPSRGGGPDYWPGAPDNPPEPPWPPYRPKPRRRWPWQRKPKPKSARGAWWK
jgi:hypothetical protein